jgi:chemotaxis protein methyltransferase CheR
MLNDSVQELVNRIAPLITSYCGIDVKKRDQRKLVDEIKKRMEALDLYDVNAYLSLLIDKNERELSIVSEILLNTESSFFRDEGQLFLLQQKILPQLIQRHESDRTLKIWSAGVATGEELYTLAIILDQLLPGRKAWRVSLIGTDIHRSALEKARQGIYGARALRKTTPKIREKYFSYHDDLYEVSPLLKQSVQFYYSNLVEDFYPNKQLKIEEIDLIICRNVFIYFNSESINLVLKKFINSLNEGGFLVTGHGELIGQEMKSLKSLLMDGSVVYQKQKT